MKLSIKEKRVLFQNIYDLKVAIKRLSQRITREKYDPLPSRFGSESDIKKIIQRLGGLK